MAAPLEFSLGISWQFGAMAVASMLLFPFFRGKYAFLAGAIAYSCIDIGQALFGMPGTIGMWTLTGAITWGIVGYFFSRQQPNGSPFSFAKLGVGGILFYDAITGPILSPLLWGTPFQDALVGQIPFTLAHIFGMLAVSLIAAPLLFPHVAPRIRKADYFFLKPSSAPG